MKLTIHNEFTLLLEVFFPNWAAVFMAYFNFYMTENRLKTSSMINSPSTSWLTPNPHLDQYSVSTRLTPYQDLDQHLMTVDGWLVCIDWHSMVCLQKLVSCSLHWLLTECGLSWWKCWSRFWLSVDWLGGLTLDCKCILYS